MDTLVREKLMEILNRDGWIVIEDAEKFEGILTAECGGKTPGGEAITGALREGIAAFFVSENLGSITPDSFEELSERVSAAAGIPIEDARWAVESWGIAAVKIPPVQASPYETGSSGQDVQQSEKKKYFKWTFIIAGISLAVGLIACMAAGIIR
jgi:hypothetical protein